MFLNRLSLRKIRNIREANLTLNQKTNVIIGENAAGKTSVLESLDILSRGRSFRTNKFESLVSSGEKSFYVGATIGGSGKKLEIHKEKNKTRVLINDKEEKKQSLLAQELAILSIHPSSHNLIEGPPSERRAFLDWGLFHVEQNFKKEWTSYIKLLKQRNEALKTRALKDDIWLEKLAEAGEQITKMRASHMTNLDKHFQQNKEHILPNLELSFLYEQGWEENSSLFDSLSAKRAIDEERGYTSVGPQNANISISLNGREAQKVCSRGQQKLIANIMLLSQSKEFYERREFPSIILVDDLSAELTLDMQEKILERLFETNSQIFLTALNDSVLADILCEMDANVFHVEHGEIT
jgi:DNA replication and repair protein RecF